MSNPQEEIGYAANLLLTVSFDNIEFTSNIKSYEFNVAGGYKHTQDELEDIVKRCFIEEHEDVFMDTDLEVVVTSIKKF